MTATPAVAHVRADSTSNDVAAPVRDSEDVVFAPVLSVLWLGVWACADEPPGCVVSVPSAGLPGVGPVGTAG